ncbi:MAG: response regulator [Spartobacteria bacterium]|nr:response regulator [Spartobacteria bacterium]
MAPMDKRILLVDDDSGLIRLLQRQLIRSGYAVDHAGDGKAGLELCLHNAYDAALLDQEMPGYTGLELLRRLRDIDRDIAIIMVTGNGNEKLAVEALKMGADDYVVKDVDGAYLEMMPRIIRQVLDHRQTRAEHEQARRVVGVQRELMQALSGLDQIREAAGLCLHALLDISGLDSGCVYIRGDVSDFEMLTQLGLSAAIQSRMRVIPRHANLAQRAMQGRPYYMEGEDIAQHDPVSLGESDPLTAWGLFPIMYEAEVIVVFLIASHQLKEISLPVRRAIESTTDQITSAMVRLKTKEDFRRLENQHRLVVDNTKDAVLLVQNGLVKFLNPIAIKLSGFEKEELLDKPFSIFVHPDDRDMVVERYKKRMEGRDVPSSYSFRTLTKSGDTRWWHVNIGSVEWNEKPAILLQASDITGQVAHEERIIRLNQCMLGFGPDPADNISALIGLSAELLQAQCAIYYRDEEQTRVVVGQNAMSVDVEEPDAMEREIARAVQEHQTLGALPIRELRNSPYAHADSNLMKAGFQTCVGHGVRSGQTSHGILMIFYREDRQLGKEELGILGILTSAIAVEEERRRAQDLLNYRIELEKRISLLSTYFLTLDGDDVYNGIDMVLNSIGRFAQVDTCYVCLLSPDGQQFFISHEWCAESVKSRRGKGNEYISMSCIPWCFERMQRGDTIHIPDVQTLPEDAAVDRAYFAASDTRSVLAVPLHDGSHLRGFLGFDMVRHAITWTDEDIRLIMVMGRIILNAMRRAETEDMLRESEARYRLNSLELKSRNDEIKHFASVVSHDLRAPLANIDGFVKELRYELSKFADYIETRILTDPSIEHLEGLQHAWEEDIPEALEFIDSSIAVMNRRIEALLNLSRLGRRDMKLTHIDVNKLVQHSLQSLSHQIEVSGAEIQVDPLPGVIADYSMMDQIVSNLLDNAIKYLDPDRKGRVRVTGISTAKDVRYRIEDNGVGIPGDQCEKVFELFKRLAPSKSDGEGIGLAAVRTLINRLGGHIWCESEEGAGTSFIFSLPKNHE